jgi:hypothetical protein
MEHYEYMLAKKQELKKLAKEIRHYKPRRKQDKRGELSLYQVICEIGKRQYEFRHQHIAYCLLRGREMHEIENKTRDDNQPNERYVNALLAEYEEAVRPSEDGLEKVEPSITSGTCCSTVHA